MKIINALLLVVCVHVIQGKPLLPKMSLDVFLRSHPELNRDDELSMSNSNDVSMPILTNPLCSLPVSPSETPPELNHGESTRFHDEEQLNGNSDSISSIKDMKLSDKLSYGFVSGKASGLDLNGALFHGKSMWNWKLEEE